MEQVIENDNLKVVLGEDGVVRVISKTSDARDERRTEIQVKQNSLVSISVTARGCVWEPATINTTPGFVVWHR